MNYLLFIIGFLLYIGLGIQKTRNKNPQKKFSYAKYFRDEALTLIIGFLSGVAVVIMLPEVIDDIIVPGKTNAIRTAYFICGYLNYSLIRGLVNSVASKKFIEQ